MMMWIENLFARFRKRKASDPEIMEKARRLIESGPPPTPEQRAAIEREYAGLTYDQIKARIKAKIDAAKKPG